MTTETTGPAPPEVLIPEARRHQKRRYRRRGAFVAIAALVVAALVVSSLLLFRGPAAGGKAQGDPKSAAAVASTSGPVYFRPVLCFAAPYAAPAGSTAKAPPTSTEPIPACSAASLLTAANLNVTPDTGPQGYSSNITPPDQQYASYPSTSVHTPGYASRTVLLPGLSGACDGVAQLRCVLGPVEMSSRAIAKAAAVRNRTGQWLVPYTTTASGAALWDRVVQQSFHGFLGIELHGVVYSAPIIQPTQASFSSFDGRGEISGNLTRSQAMQLARALNSHKG
jgi:preprotein translocase subunit SecD